MSSGWRAASGPAVAAAPAAARPARTGSPTRNAGGPRRQIALAVERHRRPRTGAGSRPRGYRAPRSMRCSSCLAALGLRGHDPHHRRQRRRLAERPQQVPVGVVESGGSAAAGRRRSRRPRVPPRPSARIPAGSARGTGPRTRRGTGRSRRRRSRAPGPRAATEPAIGADSTVTCASANCSRLSPCEPTARTRRLAAVVAEDHRPAHLGQPAHRVAQPVVEAVAARRRVLLLGEHADEQLERLDPDRGSVLLGCGVHP